MAALPRSALRIIAATLALLPVAAHADAWADERMIVASDAVVITFEGASVKLDGQNRRAGPRNGGLR